MDKITAGDTRVGTQYREVVQIAPLLRGEFLSTITRCEPPHFLEEDFEGAGMRGHLAYELASNAQGTLLIQRETLEAFGLLRLISPVIRRMLAHQLRKRLDNIRDVLDSGWEVDSSG